jgi:hypothetical protein
MLARLLSGHVASAAGASQLGRPSGELGFVRNEAVGPNRLTSRELIESRSSHMGGHRRHVPNASAAVYIAVSTSLGSRMLTDRPSAHRIGE